jgi:hypothetical protein
MKQQAMKCKEVEYERRYVAPTHTHTHSNINNGGGKRTRSRTTATTKPDHEKPCPIFTSNYYLQESGNWRHPA